MAAYCQVYDLHHLQTAKNQDQLRNPYTWQSSMGYLYLTFLPGSASARKIKPIWILLKQETVSGSGISWAICKSAPLSRQITMSAPHLTTQFFTGQMPFLPPNQQRQNTEENKLAWRPRSSRRALDESPAVKAWLRACWYIAKRSCNVVTTAAADDTPPRLYCACVGAELWLSLSELSVSSSA